MTKTQQTEPPQPGDLVVVHGHHLGEPSRTGEILEVLGEPGHEHFNVRWEDNHVSVFYPSSDATIQSRRKGENQ
jgi:Domain of unknown function (DUF1918).